MNNPDSALVYVNKLDELLNYDMTQNVPALPEIRCRKLNTVYSLFANILRNRTKGGREGKGGEVTEGSLTHL